MLSSTAQLEYINVVVHNINGCLSLYFSEIINMLAGGNNCNYYYYCNYYSIAMVTLIHLYGIQPYWVMSLGCISYE